MDDTTQIKVTTTLRNAAGYMIKTQTEERRQQDFQWDVVAEVFLGRSFAHFKGKSIGKNRAKISEENVLTHSCPERPAKMFFSNTG
ncbi:hypothetical protein TNCV_4296851 [Trichonephila clavipes]|nr:hypothetical protein TNCV_4296851 [Trichonephila clavipes]